MVMRILITGASGFVGPHLVESLRRTGQGVEILATGKETLEHPVVGGIAKLDVTDRKAVDAAITSFVPTVVFHLAGIAAPAVANADPEAAWRIHVEGTLNVARSILENLPECALLSVGSGLIYGGTANAGLPMDEDTLLDPEDEYSVTKAAADLALGGFARRGLRCIRLRPFNHTGPGQAQAFVVPAFAAQIARIEAGLQPPAIRVGNLDAERDLLDVRDLAEAYARAAGKAGEIAPGTIVNIASGKALRVGDLLDLLLSLTDKTITVERDEGRLRSIDRSRIVGDGTRAGRLLDWAPRRTIGETLADVLQDWRDRVAASR